MRPAASKFTVVSVAFATFAAACADTNRYRPPTTSPAVSVGTAPHERPAEGGAERGSSPSSRGSPGCGTRGRPSGTRKVPVFGATRSYLLAVPEGYDPRTPYPLVYVLHGNGGSGAQVRASFGLETAAKGRAIFVYPDASKGAWDLDSPTSKNPDVALFDATLAVTQGEYCVDLGRVFVAGFSNGAYMANQLGCRRGDRIRAVASHSGGGPYAAGKDGQYDDDGQLVCEGKPVASVVIHGASDGTVAPTEGEKSVQHWSHANRCSKTTRALEGSGSTACVTYDGCLNSVAACRVPGLGHSVWPRANRVVWSYFESH